MEGNYKKWINRINYKQDVLTEDNVGQFMDLELPTKLTPTSGDTVLARDILTNKAVEIPIESLGGSGNIDTSNLVPYTGATQNVNIGAYYFETSQGYKITNGTANQALTANGGTFDLNAKADLENGKIPASQLPSYVDDVLEFADLASFPATGENGKIYIAIDTNLTYRWGGSSYVVMSSSLALGETSSTAYRGDRGKIAYDHSQVTGNPHNTTKSDIGLGNVPNIDATNPTNIVQTSSYRFVTDSEKANYTTAYNHSQTTGNPHNTKVEELSDVSGTDTTIIDTDLILKKDIAGIWKKLSWSNIKETLKTYFDSLYAPKPFNVKVTTPSSYVTGTMSETEVLRIEIPANSLSASDVLKLPFVHLSKINANAVFQFRGKLSESPTMPSGTTDQIFQWNNASAGSKFLGLSRNYKIYDGQIWGFPFTENSATDIAANVNNALSSKSYNRSVTNYLYISIQLSNAIDQVRFEGMQITNS